MDTVNRDEVNDLDDPPTPVCYFIVGGNEDEYFAVEPLRHEIMVWLHNKWKSWVWGFHRVTTNSAGF
jgi:hypothetical protein